MRAPVLKNFPNYSWFPMFTVSVTVLDEIRQLTYIITVSPSTNLLDVVFVSPVPPAPPLLCILDIKKYKMAPHLPLCHVVP
jgi:hypothetical protein